MKGKNKRIDQTRQNRQNMAGLPTLRTNVAGMDLGSEEHWVCAPALEGVGREIASFGGTTAELLRLAAWLKERKVESVACIGLPRHEVLEGQGLQVMLVDTRQLAQVPGRDKKSDPSDCEWIQRLHSCGFAAGCLSTAGKKFACYGPWCGTKPIWWQSRATGCAGCRRAWIK